MSHHRAVFRAIELARLVGSAPSPHEEALMADKDTLNRFGVTTDKGQVISLRLNRSFTPEEARNLAAWLIVGLELLDIADAAPGLERAEVLERVKAIAGG